MLFNTYSRSLDFVPFGKIIQSDFWHKLIELSESDLKWAIICDLLKNPQPDLAKMSILYLCFRSGSGQILECNLTESEWVLLFQRISKFYLLT